LNFLKDLDIEVYDGVYKPAEDTYLLLDLLELNGVENVLEIGCGTGIISIHCGSLGCEVLSVDKNKKALENTEFNAKNNDIDISVKRSDLFSEIKKKDWDVIILNPPYLPEAELLNKDDRWDGGKRGDELIVRFLDEAATHLCDQGELYFCYSSLSPTEEIEKIIEEHYEVVDLQKEEFFYESLYGKRLKKSTE